MRVIRNLFGGRRARMERDLARELRDHLDRRVADLVRSGVDPAEARRLARVEFGGSAQVQEEVRDTWGWRWLTDRGRDLRYATRALTRKPAFAITAILSLAIGIGASAAIFSLVDQVLLRPLPVREPERLVLLGWNGIDLAPGFGSGNLLSERICRGLQDADTFFDGVFCRHPREINLIPSASTRDTGCAAARRRPGSPRAACPCAGHLRTLVLSVVGLFGVMSFVVTSRTREIGIRLALGAGRSSAVWHVMRDALAMIAVGAALALPAVWSLGRFVEAQLFGVSPIDAPTIAGASLLLLAAAGAGAMFPAWRAASVRPTEALRVE